LLFKGQKIKKSYGITPRQRTVRCDSQGWTTLKRNVSIGVPILKLAVFIRECVRHCKW